AAVAQEELGHLQGLALSGRTDRNPEDDIFPVRLLSSTKPGDLRDIYPFPPWSVLCPGYQVQWQHIFAFHFRLRGEFCAQVMEELCGNPAVRFALQKVLIGANCRRVPAQFWFLMHFCITVCKQDR